MYTSLLTDEALRDNEAWQRTGVMPRRTFGCYCPRLGIDTRTDEERARDAALPPPTVTTDAEGGPYYVTPATPTSDQVREIIEQFERDHPEDAAALDELRRLTDLMDQWSACEGESVEHPQTWSSAGTNGQWAAPPSDTQWRNPDPAATMKLVSIEQPAGWPLWLPILIMGAVLAVAWAAFWHIAP